MEIKGITFTDEELEACLELIKKMRAKSNKPVEEIKEDKWSTYWWIIDDSESELCGEQFFTELKNADYKEHQAYVKKLFPNEKPYCFGEISAVRARMMDFHIY